MGDVEKSYACKNYLFGVAVCQGYVKGQADHTKLVPGFYQ